MNIIDISANVSSRLQRSQIVLGKPLGRSLSLLALPSIQSRNLHYILFL